MRWIRRMIYSGLLGLMIACDQTPQVSSSSTGLNSKRNFKAEVLEMGKKVYQQHCAVCHANEAQGVKEWRQPGADGKYPPPPLNGSGHAWHHSRLQLKNAILHGTQPTGNMPAWQGRLSDQEIEAVISYFQSLWPEPVYSAWYEMQSRGNL